MLHCCCFHHTSTATVLPSAMAPSTSMPDSFSSQSWWNRSSFSIGRMIGKMSLRNTLASTSSAAAEHFPVTYTSSSYITIIIMLTYIAHIRTRHKCAIAFTVFLKVVSNMSAECRLCGKPFRTTEPRTDKTVIPTACPHLWNNNNNNNNNNSICIAP